MIDHKGRFIYEDYMRREPFCSFLPGVAGERGVPMWCYYVSRGQCVTSFGVEDKDHAIMEFFPAHQAYQYTQRTGFRTFIRRSAQVAEPFARAGRDQRMIIDMNALTIEERTEDGLFVRVDYTTLPGERCAALLRRVTLRNDSAEEMEFDLLDGMPALLPYGLNMYFVKEMTQTAKAWMQAEDREQDVVCFRVRASLEDRSDVQTVEGVNFACARTDAGEALRAFVDPRHVFGWDTSLERPEGFLAASMEAFAAQEETPVNCVPCCFYARTVRLAPGEETAQAMMIGQAESKARARAACEKLNTLAAIDAKFDQARALTASLTDGIATKTGDPVFDMYCRQTMLDNLLRGGTPVQLPGGKMVHLYSRKHGDPERDYNAFRMRPEYASQGNGNFRDVCQNRRCDVLFDPRVGEKNVRQFFSLIQADGYNPLVIQFVQYTLGKEAQAALLDMLAEESRAAAAQLLAGSFTPGQLMMAAETWAYAPGCTQEALLEAAFSAAQEGTSAVFGEGYWSDHWTYNLDQIEAYLSVYPEREEALLCGQEMTWFSSPVSILPRAQRYVKTKAGVRQYRYHEEKDDRGGLLRARDGSAVTASLMEKLLVLCAVKTAALDPFGMGVEMEGGKPGWYDALNGLPGLLGSSMPETLELARVLGYTAKAVRRYGCSVRVMAEAARMMRETASALEALRGVWEKEEAIVPVWDALSDVREAYRAALMQDVSGEKTEIAADELAQLLDTYAAFVMRGIEKAMAHGNGGLCPTYFAYDVTVYTEDGAGLHPTAFALRRMPDFLEGQVRYLRLDIPQAEKERLAAAVKASRLYDAPLGMYKVNAALGEASYEIGRAHAFTPGWLENESVWLHMEYKYLLELLRSHQYGAFISAFHQAAVPFLDSAVYGRSVLENSSFIASSANPDPRIRGKGFVARLSGSTAEFLSIWQIMLLGETLFATGDGALTFALSPLLPSYLTEGTDAVEATLLGGTRVVYHIAPGESYIPGQYRVEGMKILWRGGGSLEAAEGVVTGAAAERIREGEAEMIEVTLAK